MVEHRQTHRELEGTVSALDFSSSEALTWTSAMDHWHHTSSYPQQLHPIYTARSTAQHMLRTTTEWVMAIGDHQSIPVAYALKLLMSSSSLLRDSYADRIELSGKCLPMVLGSAAPTEPGATPLKRHITMSCQIRPPKLALESAAPSLKRPFRLLEPVFVFYVLSVSFKRYHPRRFNVFRSVPQRQH
ncbi:hypothetical protein CORC01_11430 [Colletotrichum orchidophilum]|uniref:Uncharacterized protein n=1 Tax=Colletotrichum orchidophilum TaxID=1209926 RepID=A0A1G4AVX2_9PEZI|nr:uncharacterized protein CORC01_11430 [Colletotrichum orchidophilum]OHE93287.1 hypothetical protein CORC01_11430 [Colletotrichum orchidophilum]